MHPMKHVGVTAASRVRVFGFLSAAASICFEVWGS